MPEEWRSHSEPRGRRGDLHDFHALEPSEGQVDLDIKMSVAPNKRIVFIISETNGMHAKDNVVRLNDQIEVIARHNEDNRGIQ